MTKAEQHGQHSRTWERGRLARIAGKGSEANPHTGSWLLVPAQRRREWLAGWLHADAAIQAKGDEQRCN